MGEVFGEILRKKNLIIFLYYCPYFYILDIANAISGKVFVLEARNFYQLIEYND